MFLLGTGPAGNLYSSVDDLSKFLVCLFDEGSVGEREILKPETFRDMTTPHQRCRWQASKLRARVSRSGVGWLHQDWSWWSGLWVFDPVGGSARAKAWSCCGCVA